MTWRKLETEQDCRDLLSLYVPRLCIIYFTSPKAATVSTIGDTFVALSEQYTDVKFGCCDIDSEKVKDIGRRYSISVIPTFVFFRGGKEIERVQGYQASEVKRVLQRNYAGY